MNNKNDFLIENMHKADLLQILLEQEEEATAESAENLRKQVEEQLVKLEGLVKNTIGKRIQNFPDSDFKSAMASQAQWFAEQVDTIKDDLDGLESEMSQAMGGLGDIASAYAGLTQQVTELMTGMHNLGHVSKSAIAVLAQYVLDKNLHRNSGLKDVPMRDIFEDDAELDGSKIAKEMTSAMGKEVRKPKKKGGGLIGMIKDFFGFGGTDIEVGPLGESGFEMKDLAELAIGMTPIQVGKSAEALMDMVKEQEAAEQEIESAQEEINTEIQDASEEAENQEGEGKEDEEVEAEDDLTPEEAADEAEEELKDAAQEAAQSEEPPAVAIANALDAWAAGLSPTSQKSLAAKNRLGSLKAAVDGSLEKAADAVQNEVEQAIANWRSENEETLLKSRRFAKKNFDSLQSLIPQIAGAILKKTNESQSRLTKSMIHKSVYRYLDKRFGSSVISESARWQKLAGIN